MKRNRILSLVLALLMAVGLFAGITPAPRALDRDLIGDLKDQFSEASIQSYMDDLFDEGNIVKQGRCGKGDGTNPGSNVWYQIYEVSAAKLTSVPYYQTLMELTGNGYYTEGGYLALDPEEDYYGVKIFGNGDMFSYKRVGQSAPWCDHVKLDWGKRAGETVDMDKKLAVAYVGGTGTFKTFDTSGKPSADLECKTGVTNVGRFAFYGQGQLTSVYLGNTVTRIEDSAFESTEMLAAINMPSKLGDFKANTYTHTNGDAVAVGEGIGRRAFYGCDKLTFWDAKGCPKFTSIGERAFYGNAMLTKVWFPEAMTTIGNMAFAWCHILGDAQFSLPSALVTIGNGAFMFDTHMGRANEVNIPSHVQTIGDFAFLCCFGIGKGDDVGLTFSPSTTPLSIGRYAFAGCRELQKLTLGNQVTQVHTGAFAACERLKSVKFGTDQNARVVAIDARAFTSMESSVLTALDAIETFSAGTTIGDEASDYIPTTGYDSEELAAFSSLTNMTPLGDAAFQNRPANRIEAASSATHSFPVDCVVHYPTASYNPSANTEWLSALDSGATTWKGYQTEGDFTGHVHDLKELRRFDATCTEDGMIVYECQDRGCTLPDRIYTKTIPALGHDTSKFEVKDATCTEAGYRKGTCPRCGETINETIPAKGHSTRGMTLTREPTCTQAGEYSGRCIECGKTVTVSVPALGHDWGAWKTTKAATATEAGEMKRVCKHDATHVQTKVIPPTGGDDPDPVDPTPTPAPRFVDVKSGSWYEAAVNWAVDNSITDGTDDTHFSPNKDCTRAQMVTFLWRSMDCPEPSGTENPFKDVQNPNAYYYKAVLWAYGEKITDGTTATTFSPNDTVTRGQVVTFLWRMEGELKVSASNPFSDVSPSNYYYNAVLWAVENGITDGIDATHFAPKSACTRAHIVTFLYRDLNEI